ARVQLARAVQHGQRGDGAQLALLLGNHLAAVEAPGEEHAELTGQRLVEALPRLVAHAAGRQRVEQRSGRAARELLEIAVVTHVFSRIAASSSGRDSMGL